MDLISFGCSSASSPFYFFFLLSRLCNLSGLECIANLVINYPRCIASAQQMQPRVRPRGCEIEQPVFVANRDERLCSWCSWSDTRHVEVSHRTRPPGESVGGFRIHTRAVTPHRALLSAHNAACAWAARGMRTAGSLLVLFEPYSENCHIPLIIIILSADVMQTHNNRPHWSFELDKHLNKDVNSSSSSDQTNASSVSAAA